MKNFLLIVAMFALSVIQAGAKNDDEVTLVVSADGITKEEATKTALRSAIEQAYGTFVSANTTILNDDLIKDEIVTISNGNIKEFSELSYNNLQDGRSFVTLKVTVSVSKLTQFAQNKGAETEFAGATFEMDVKMKKLNKENELIVLRHMEDKIGSIKNLFDYKIELEEPVTASNVGIRSDSYAIQGNILLFYNTNTDLFNDILYNTIEAIGLDPTNEELMDYENKGFRLEARTAPTSNESFVYLRNRYPNSAVPSFNGRKPLAEVINTIEKLHNKDLPYELYKNEQLFSSTTMWPEWHFFAKAALSFVISDNISSPTSLSVLLSDNPVFSRKLYSYTVTTKRNEFTGKEKKKVKKTTKIGDKVGKVPIIILIPKDDISKYSKFTVK